MVQWFLLDVSTKRFVTRFSAAGLAASIFSKNGGYFETRLGWLARNQIGFVRQGAERLARSFSGCFCANPSSIMVTNVQLML